MREVGPLGGLGPGLLVRHPALREKLMNGLPQTGDTTRVDKITMGEPVVAFPTLRTAQGNPRKEEEAIERAPRFAAHQIVKEEREGTRDDA